MCILGETFDGRPTVFLDEISGVCESKVGSIYSCCDLRLLQEAKDSALAKNLNLHWLGEIHLFYPDDSLDLCLTQLAHYLRVFSAVES